MKNSILTTGLLIGLITVVSFTVPFNSQKESEKELLIKEKVAALESVLGPLDAVSYEKVANSIEVK